MVVLMKPFDKKAKFLNYMVSHRPGPPDSVSTITSQTSQERRQPMCKSINSFMTCTTMMLIPLSV